MKALLKLTAQTLLNLTEPVYMRRAKEATGSIPPPPMCYIYRRKGETKFLTHLIRFSNIPKISIFTLSKDGRNTKALR